MKGYVLNFPLRLMITDGKTMRIALLHCMPQYRTSGSSMRLCKTVSRSSLEMEQSPSSENSTTSGKKTKTKMFVFKWWEGFFTSQVVSYTVILFCCCFSESYQELVRCFWYQLVLSVFQNLKLSRIWRIWQNKIPPPPSKFYFFNWCYRKIETLKYVQIHICFWRLLWDTLYTFSVPLTVQMLENFFEILRHVP